jgi:hypothetical protein
VYGLRGIGFASIYFSTAIQTPRYRQRLVRTKGNEELKQESTEHYSSTARYTVMTSGNSFRLTLFVYGHASNHLAMSKPYDDGMNWSEGVTRDPAGLEDSKSGQPVWKDHVLHRPTIRSIMRPSANTSQSIQSFRAWPRLTVTPVNA